MTLLLNIINVLFGDTSRLQQFPTTTTINTVYALLETEILF